MGVNIGEKFGSPWGQTLTLGSGISLFLNLSFLASGILILVFIVIGGLGIISGAGNNNPQAVAKGKQAFTSALIGLIVVFTAFWVIRVIEIITGYQFITLPQFQYGG